MPHSLIGDSVPPFIFKDEAKVKDPICCIARGLAIFSIIYFLAPKIRL
jgi:hypothetical protein